MTEQPAQLPEPPDQDWRSRCILALGIVNQRGPSVRVAELMQLALNGATLQDLIDAEKLR